MNPSPYTKEFPMSEKENTKELSDKELEKVAGGGLGTSFDDYSNDPLSKPFTPGFKPEDSGGAVDTAGPVQIDNPVDSIDSATNVMGTGGAS